MSHVADKTNLKTLASLKGVEVIGAAQRTIAFASVASAGTGLIQITTSAAHDLKKNQTIYITSGPYQGIYRVRRIPTTTTIIVDGTFSATSSGNITLTASLKGKGFTVNNITGFAIAEFVPEKDNIDAKAIIDKPFVVGEEFTVPFKRIRITGGDITVVRNDP